LRADLAPPEETSHFSAFSSKSISRCVKRSRPSPAAAHHCGDSTQSKLIRLNFTFVQPFSDITGACQMNTRPHCIAPAPSIANWQLSSANWREPASSQDRGEAYYGSRCRSIAEPSISTARPRERALRDRRKARMDVVAACRALGIRDAAAGAQTLTILSPGSLPALRYRNVSPARPRSARNQQVPSKPAARAGRLSRKPGRWLSRCPDK